MDTVVCVGIFGSRGFGAGDTVHEIEIGGGRFGHHVADSAGGFTFDPFPAGGFCVAVFGGADFFLPSSLDFV